MNDVANKQDHNWADDFRELINGGYIMLFIFGMTVCVIASLALFALLFILKEADAIKIAIAKDIVIGGVSFISGMYSTMWNNQHFKDQKAPANGVSTTVALKSNQPTQITTGDPKP